MDSKILVIVGFIGVLVVGGGGAWMWQVKQESDRKVAELQKKAEEEAKARQKLEEEAKARKAAEDAAKAKAEAEAKAEQERKDREAKLDAEAKAKDATNKADREAAARRAAEARARQAEADAAEARRRAAEAARAPAPVGRGVNMPRVDERYQSARTRIESGFRSNALTRGEYDQLNRELDNFVRMRRDVERDGVATEAERQDLNRELSRIHADIDRLVGNYNRRR